MEFRKKPVVIEAVRWDENLQTLMTLQESGMKTALYIIGREVDSIVGLQIQTLEGNHQVLRGDWIIKGVKGEFYPCKPDIFELTYEPVD